MLRSALVITVIGAGFGWYLAHAALPDRASLIAAIQAAGGGLPRETLPQAKAAVPAAVPQAGASLSGDTFAIDADRSGQFQTSMQIGGRELPALIDTGASHVALTYDAAASIGIHPTDAEFRWMSQTANGTARSAAVVIPRIRVGNVEAHNVQAFVSQRGALTGESLLGMSFLNKLSGFEIRTGRLILRQ